jgi:hypothetical protein
MKSGIFEVQRRENQADSDPRLQILLREQQGVSLSPTACSTAASFHTYTSGNYEKWDLIFFKLKNTVKKCGKTIFITQNNPSKWSKINL